MTARFVTKQPQAGFTLLELLISITLLGMLLVLLFGGLRLGLRSWDAVQRQVDNLNSVRSLEIFLRREMEQIHPYRWSSTTNPTLAFQGTPDRVQFVAPMAARIGAGGLHAASLELEQAGDRRRIVWRNQPIDSESKDFSVLTQAAGMVLASAELEMVDTIALSYFGPERDGQPPQWWDRWEGRTTLPSLIRVKIRFRDGTEWPEFVVAQQLVSRVGR